MKTYNHNDIVYTLNEQKTLDCLFECISNAYTDSFFLVYESQETGLECMVEVDPKTGIQTIHENVKTVIGSQIELILLGFNNNRPIIAKVDTGASYCSLHGTDISYSSRPYGEGELVSFTFEDQRYRMPVVNKQSVQNSDGGITYRPVVQFSVSMNDKTYEEVLFNVNDRSDMTHMILLGQNLLKQSRVLVDPTLYMESANTIEDVVKTKTKKSVKKNDSEEQEDNKDTDVEKQSQTEDRDVSEQTETKSPSIGVDIKSDEFVKSVDKFKNLTLQDIINALNYVNS